jgi:hypothetical protein
MVSGFFVWRDKMTKKLDNPLWLLQNGPMEPDNLEQIAVDLVPDFPRKDIKAMLRQIQEKPGILVPEWWRESPQNLRESPQSFRETMDEELIALSFSTRLSRARQQSRVLEALLRIWRRKFNPNLPIYKIERIQKPKTVLESTLIETIKLHKDKLGLSFTRDPHSLPGSLEYLLLVDVGRLNPDRVGKIGLSDYEEGWTQVELTGEAGFQIVDIFEYVINLWKDSYEVAHPAVIRYLTESDGATLKLQEGSHANSTIEQQPRLPQEIVGTPEFIFDLGKQIVDIRYGKEKGLFKRTKGLEYLHHLLFAPNQDIDSTQLVIGFEPIGNSPMAEDHEGLHESRDRQEIMDEQCYTECKDRLRDIVDAIKDLDEKKDRGEIVDSGEYEDLVEEKQKFIDIVQSSMGKYGKSRAFTTQGEKARLSVKKSINRSMRQIEKQMPNFALHLKKDIHTGYTCRYSPQEQVTWSKVPM